MANWNVKYGASLRKRYLAVVAQKKDVYVCSICGKRAVRRISTGIWQCKSCGATFAGGAFTPSTEEGKNLERVIMQMKEGTFQASSSASAPAGAGKEINQSKQS